MASGANRDGIVVQEGEEAVTVSGGQLAGTLDWMCIWSEHDVAGGGRETLCCEV